MPDVPIRLMSLAHGGGCGCKIAPSLLTEITASLPAMNGLSDLLVGTETCDDAAVYRLNPEQAIVATTDFFMPVVDDPYDFGRIAATNALSDVYAMGAKPLLALAVVGMPVNALPVETPAAIPSTRPSQSTDWWRSDWSIRIISSATAARGPATHSF